jgi:FixJ family two-component response regulator
MAGEPSISVIDDDQSLRTALVGLIRSLGYGARGFASAEEFLDSGAETDSSCVITDIQMPGMNGIDLAHLIAQRHSHLPVIMITAHTEPRIEEDALATGAICFLRKPIDTNALIDWIEQALKA